MEQIKKKKLTKEAINIIRTTQRNNVDLTHIADNKANVLLSLNAIMITFLIPTVVSNIDYIVEKYLYIPLIILAVTCFVTIYISAIVLKPTSLDKLRDKNEKTGKHSPFFFGNFYKMSPKEYFNYVEDSLSSGHDVRQHLTRDLYFFGKRLAIKMIWTRHAFNIFLTGIFLSIISTAIVFIIS